MMGYDALFFNNIEDDKLIDIALKEGRVVLTRDTQIAERRIATNGQLKVVLTKDDDPKPLPAMTIPLQGKAERFAVSSRCPSSASR